MGTLLTADEFVAELTLWDTLQVQAAQRRECENPFSLRMLDEAGGDHELHILAMNSANVSATSRRRIERTVRSGVVLVRDLMAQVSDLETQVADLEAQVRRHEADHIAQVRRHEADLREQARRHEADLRDLRALVRRYEAAAEPTPPRALQPGRALRLAPGPGSQRSAS